MERLAWEEKRLEELDQLVEEITADAYGDDEQLEGFRQAFELAIGAPCDAFVVGEPIVVTAFDYDGNRRRGVTATCRRDDGTAHLISAADVLLPTGAPGERYLAAYRRWSGLDPFPAHAGSRPRKARSHKADEADIDLTATLDLVVLAVKDKAARCRLTGSERGVTLRAESLWRVAPGEIVTVRPRKQWRYAGHPYLSGEIIATRLEVSALGLVPLRLEPRGDWDPHEAYWGEKDEPIPEWAEAIIARGTRPEFEMEQIIPGEDPDDPDTDPIIESNDLKAAGDRTGARKLLMELCQADLRCLDAHAHLGNMELGPMPAAAIRHYKVGVGIGELSLGRDFDGLLPWGWLDNRPFLRCMHGYSLCLWRLGRFEEAERVLERVLWLDPVDSLGERFNLRNVKAREAWTEEDQR